jgi:hypothetical protein
MVTFLMKINRWLKGEVYKLHVLRSGIIVKEVSVKTEL